MKELDAKSSNDLNEIPAIINIYNFIRKTVYPSGEFVQEDFDTVLYQIEMIKQYGLSATYALKYDALIDNRYSDLIKENIDEHDEIGVWWEIDQQLAERSGVKWKGKTPVDDTVNIGYSLAYTSEERIKMVDTYMKDFKEIFGYYPKSVGSWVMDIITFKYFKEKYDIVAGVLCRDQIGTDGFTLTGGYYNGGYYPSTVNEYIPAQNKENQLDLPIFRLLGPDPIYSFEDGIRDGVNCVYTLEPASVIAQNKDWIEWYFDRLISEKNLGFTYAQVGQENTFLWSTMHKGYELQIPYIANLEKQGKVRIQTLKETGEWYKKRYQLTPPTTFVASKDWNLEEDLKTVWYNSRFYRVSFLLDNNKLSIRDLHLFDENYKSRYYDEILENQESIFDALPILNAHYWGSKEKRASIDLVEIKGDGKLIPIIGEDIKLETLNESSYQILWKYNDIDEFKIINNEDSIYFEFINNHLEDKYENMHWGLHINTLPVLREINSKKLICSHNGFSYEVSLALGSFTLQEDNSVLITSEDNKIAIILDNKNKSKGNNEFFNRNYVENKEVVDKYIKSCEKIKNNSNVKLRAFKPVITPNVVLSIGEVNESIIIQNPNEDGVIYYSIDGSNPDENSCVYKEPIEINKVCVIKAIAYRNGFKESEIVDGYVYRTIPIKSIKGLSNPTDNKKYNKKGVQDLIDGKKGSKYYTDGNWLGYTEDMSVVVDLEEEMYIKNVMVGFLQDTRAWIYYPRYVEIEVSTNGEYFESIGKVKLENSTPRKEVGVENIKVKINKPIRYIKIFAKNEEVCPSWSIMPGEGPTFMFVDQVTME